MGFEKAVLIVRHKGEVEVTRFCIKECHIVPSICHKVSSTSVQAVSLITWKKRIDTKYKNVIFCLELYIVFKFLGIK